jgi:hypothetical protein
VIVGLLIGASRMCLEANLASSQGTTRPNCVLSRTHSLISSGDVRFSCAMRSAAGCLEQGIHEVCPGFRVGEVDD